MMTPTKFLLYSIIGIVDLMILLAWLGLAWNQLLNVYRRAVRIKFEERKTFLDSLDPSQSEAYKTMN